MPDLLVTADVETAFESGAPIDSSHKQSLLDGDENFDFEKDNLNVMMSPKVK